MSMLDSGSQESSGTCCGFVAIIGAPNVGKSTLVNRLTGTKISIVSHKVQTTRANLRGIYLADRSQVVLIDTPGLFQPKRRLDRAMVQSAWSGATDADVVALLLDARKGVDEAAENILDKLREIKAPKILILNKIDTIKRESLLSLIGEIGDRIDFERVFMISALNGDGVDDLKQYLADSMPKGPWHYPEDQISDAPLRFLSAEITREQIYRRLHQELPYSCTVETENWEEKKDGSVKVQQVIFVERKSQKPIVLGKGGQTIKDISSEAREELSRMLDRKVHLFLFVKVRESWINDPERYRAMGLELPSS